MGSTVVSKGWQTKVGVGVETTPGTVVTPTVGIEVTDETFEREVNHEEFDGMNGSRVAPKQNDVVTTIAPKSGWTQAVRIGDIETLLRLLTGDTSSPYTPQSSIESFTARVDKGGIQIRHSGSKISQVTFEASQADQILKATVEAVGMVEDVPVSGTSTIPDPDATSSPLLFRMLTLEVDDTTYAPTGIRVTINNGLITDHFRNSQTRATIPEGPATLEGEFSIDWNSTNKTLYDRITANTWGKLEATFSDGTDTVLITCNQIKFLSGATKAERGGAILIVLPFRAKGTGPGQTDLYSVTVTNA